MHAKVPQPDDVAGLGAGWQGQLFLAIQGGHHHHVAQGRLGDIDAQFEDDRVPLAHKELVRADRDVDVQVARRPAIAPGLAFPGQPYAVAIVDTMLAIANGEDPAAADRAYLGLLAACAGRSAPAASPSSARWSTT